MWVSGLEYGFLWWYLIIFSQKLVKSLIWTDFGGKVYIFLKLKMFFSLSSFSFFSSENIFFLKVLVAKGWETE